MLSAPDTQFAHCNITFKPQLCPRAAVSDIAERGVDSSCFLAFDDYEEPGRLGSSARHLLRSIPTQSHRVQRATCLFTMALWPLETVNIELKAARELEQSRGGAEGLGIGRKRPAALASVPQCPLSGLETGRFYVQPRH